MSQTDTMSAGGGKISNAPDSNSFAVSFTHLKLRRSRHKENYMTEKARQGSDYRTVKITCRY